MKATLLRVVLAAALAAATGIEQVRAQCDGNCTRPQPSIPGQLPSSNNSTNVWWVVGGIVSAFVGAAITQIIQQSQQPPPTGPSTGQAQLPPSPPGGGGPSPGGPANPAGPTGPGLIALRNGFNLPPPGALYDLTHVILDIPATVPNATRDDIFAFHNMTLEETVRINLLGRTLYLGRINDGTSVPDMLRNVSAANPQVVGGQANLFFFLTQAETLPVNNDQYAPGKLDLLPALRLAQGNRVLVAVIDSEVDATHPDLAGAIMANFDSSGEQEPPQTHGTGMAGAIAAHRAMLGTAPRAGLLTVRAFGTRGGSVEGTTFNILKGLDWAASQGARIVNMSFAGPSDPRLRQALAQANRKGMVLIAAAGNAGPSSPPLFPAADPNVIAVTATDANDALFPGANRGNYIAVAAPGVDILAPAPQGTYQFTTGTSVAAAEVSGVAALLIERNPALKPADVRRILMDTAKPLGGKPRDRDFGAGLVDALKAVTAVKPR